MSRPLAREMLSVRGDGYLDRVRRYFGHVRENTNQRVVVKGNIEQLTSDDIDSFDEGINLLHAIKYDWIHEVDGRLLQCSRNDAETAHRATERAIVEQLKRHGLG